MSVPDRSHLATEQRNPQSMNLHTLDVAACVALIVAEDRASLQCMQRAQPALTALIEAAEPGFVAGGRLIYLGAGTSGRLGVLDASEAPPTFQVEPGRVVGIIAGGDRSLRQSSESREDEWEGAHESLTDLDLQPKDTVIGTAAGGTTPYVLGGLEFASHAGALTGMVVATPIEPPSFVDQLVVLETGPEVVTGSTRMKAGTATKMALNTISTGAMIRMGKTFGNLMVDLTATNEKLKQRSKRIVSQLTELDLEASAALLDRCGGEVKTAVVAQQRRVSPDEARRILVDCDQHLRRALQS